MKRLFKPDSAINSISFSPDGKKLISATKDKSLLLWDFDLNNLLNSACYELGDYLRTNLYNKDKRSLCNK
ncbi:MAG: hypothetical protein HC908_07000 [Calothrix sp. SM1_7_51]|nr:hypothetical protein [Calothrix sp. SM1_7_51]